MWSQPLGDPEISLCTTLVAPEAPVELPHSTWHICPSLLESHPPWCENWQFSCQQGRPRTPFGLWAFPSCRPGRGAGQDERGICSPIQVSWMHPFAQLRGLAWFWCFFVLRQISVWKTVWLLRNFLAWAHNLSNHILHLIQLLPSTDCSDFVVHPVVRWGCQEQSWQGHANKCSGHVGCRVLPFLYSLCRAAAPYPQRPFVPEARHQRHLRPGNARRQAGSCNPVQTPALPSSKHCWSDPSLSSNCSGQAWECWRVAQESDRSSGGHLNVWQIFWGQLITIGILIHVGQSSMLSSMPLGSLWAQCQLMHCGPNRAAAGLREISTEGGCSTFSRHFEPLAFLFKLSCLLLPLSQDLQSGASQTLHAQAHVLGGELHWSLCWIYD